MTVNIGGANIGKIQLTEQVGNPATPSSGKGFLYEKTDGGVYFINDGGTVVGPMAAAINLVTGTTTALSGASALVIGNGLSLSVTGTVAFVNAPAVSIQNWTPVVVQSVGVTGTVSYAKYQKIGSTVQFWAQINILSAGTTANDITIAGLPFEPANNPLPIGMGYINDNGTGFYVGILRWLGSNMTIRAHLETNDVGSDPSFALANGDALEVYGSFPI